MGPGRPTLAPWPHHLLRCALLFGGLHLGRPAAAAALPEPSVFVIFSHGLQGCLEAQGGQVRVSPACNASLPAQRWKWVSRNRLFNLGTMQCLGTGWPGTNTTASLGMYECDREALSLRWNCRTLGDQLSLLLGGRSGNTSKAGTPERGDQTRSGQWRIYGSDEDLCARPYYEVYTIQGNSHGKPCTIPFKYDNQWFHGCTSTGREDGHLWCATTQDYGKDERWGFCPIKGNDCETFWDKDQLTDSCYQFNFQSTLSWREAWASCEQQGADLLSITEIHEQTYINGLLTGYSSTLWIGLNDLDTSGGWQWSDNSPLKYLNWESDQPDNPSEENCGVIRTESSGGWQNRDCSIALPYVCKKKPNATAAEPPPPAATVKAVVPHVTQASITVGGEQIGAIRWVIGMLLGVSLEDAQKKLEHVGWKILNLRVFEDGSGKHWSKSVMDKQYDVLCQSSLQRVLKGNEPDFHLPMPAGQAEAFYKGFLEPLCKVARPELIKDGKFSAYLQVHIQNDGPVAVEPESPAPGAVASDSEHLAKLEKQQQKTEKARAKGPSESSKKRSAPHKEDHKASSGA